MKNGNESWDVLGDSRKCYRGPWTEIGKYWPGKEPIRFQDSLPCALKKKIIFFHFFKIRKKNQNSKNSLILKKWNTARSLYASLMALAKQNLTRLFDSSMKYRPVQHLLALLSLLLYCYAIFSCQGNGTGKNMPRPVALKNSGRNAEQWKRLHLTTHTLTFLSLGPDSVKSTNVSAVFFFCTSLGRKIWP